MFHYIVFIASTNFGCNVYTVALLTTLDFEEHYSRLYFDCGERHNYGSGHKQTYYSLANHFHPHCSHRKLTKYRDENVTLSITGCGFGEFIGLVVKCPWNVPKANSKAVLLQLRHIFVKFPKQVKVCRLLAV